MNCAENIWADILKETRLSSNLKPCTPKHVVVLGDEASGKSTLVEKVFPVKSWSTGSAMMYGYVATRDHHGNKDQARLSVWVLKGSRNFQEKARLLKFALTKDRLDDTLVLLVLPADQLQTSCLEYYANLLLKHVHSFGLSDNEEEAFCKRPTATSYFFQRGGKATPTLSHPLSQNPATVASTDLNAVKVELGLPIIVVVTKTDSISSLIENGFHGDHLDFMQRQLHTFCIDHGAALIHTSAVSDVNCQLLYQYTVDWMNNQSLSKYEDEMDIADGIFSWNREVKKSRPFLFGSDVIINEDQYNVFPHELQQQSLSRESHQKSMLELVVAEEESVFLARIQSILMDDNTKKTDQAVVQHVGSNPLVKVEVNFPLQSKLEPGNPDSKIELANFFGSLLGKPAK